MPHKHLFTTIFAILSSLQIFAQSFSLSFSAVDSENNRYQLDSVQIFDMSQGWTTTLIFPDTILNLTIGSNSINRSATLSQGLSAYPNPTRDKTIITVFSAHETTAGVKIYRNDGNAILVSDVALSTGDNHIEIAPGGSGVFYVQVTIDGKQNVIKFISLGSYGLCYLQKIQTRPTQLKGENTGTFTTNDILRIVGYATFQSIKIESEPIVGNITNGRTITFSLPINYSVPIVTTSEPSEVTMTSVKCGGTVVSDGGKPVTTRGLCYSSERTPTIEDNIISCGDGVGPFTSNVENLQPGTTYLIRAFAFNSLGFAYGETMSFTTPVSDIDPSEDGSLPGLFSINDSQQVCFSKGNLQYSNIGNHLTATSDIATGTYRFAETQYLYIGDNNANASESYSGFIDLFGYATSGWNSGATAYQPYSTSTSNADYLFMHDINGTNADWGYYNAIQNGGNQPGMWRVLSAAERQNILNDSVETRNGRNAQATLSINGTEYKGILLLPDNFNLPEGCYYTAGYVNGFSTNQYTLEQWQMMEQAGAVFIVAAGRRNGTTLAHQNARCIYWSGTLNDEYSSHILYCVSGSIQSNGLEQVHTGAAVRLVRIVE